VRVIRVFSLLTIVSAAAAVSAVAAPHPQGLFVDMRMGHDRDDTRPAIEISGATPRVGVSVGYDWGRSGLEFDVTVAGWHTAVYESTYVYRSPSNGLQQEGHVYEEIKTVRRRSVDEILLYRLNVPVHRRVGLTWLIGGGKVHRPDRSNATLNEVLPDGTRRNIYSSERTSSGDWDYYVGVTRFDADVRLAERLWIGPRLSLTMYPSGFDKSGHAPRAFVARPELAVRWRF